MLAKHAILPVLGLSAIAAVGAAPARAGSYKYTTFTVTLNPPGNISVNGIDAAGDVVGSIGNYSKKNKSGTEVAFAVVNGKTKLATPIGGKFHSFVQSVSSNGIAILGRTPTGKTHTTYLKWDIVSGKTSPLYAKGAPKMYGPEYLNANGDFVGNCYAGACFESANAITVMTPPNAYEGDAEVVGLNDSGFAAGNYGYQSGPDIASGLYTYENGTINTYTIPNATGMSATGVASNGAVVGYYGTGSVTDGFTLIGSTVTSLSYPGATDTAPFGINSSGQIVGLYSGGTFLYQNGTFYPVTIPNGSDIYAFYINDQGTIAGSYTPANSKVQVGFIATCATGPGTCTP